MSGRIFAMKRTEVVRQASDQLKETEAAIDVALVSARATLNRLVAAKSELGLTGTMGDRSIARMREVVAALEEAGTVALESHADAYDVYKAVDFKGAVAIRWDCLNASADAGLRVVA
jgi:hypothetical protein